MEDLVYSIVERLLRLPEEDRRFFLNELRTNNNQLYCLIILKLKKLKENAESIN